MFTHVDATACLDSDLIQYALCVTRYTELSSVFNIVAQSKSKLFSLNQINSTSKGPFTWPRLNRTELATQTALYKDG